MTDPSRVPQAHRVILVRHAAARRLSALALFDHAGGFYAGPEPRMAQTLTPVAAGYDFRVQVDEAFAETHSAGFFDDEEEFLATVRRFFEQPDEPPAPGWEAASDAATRFAAGIDRLRAVHQPVVRPGHALPGTFAIASGGRALTAYLAHTLGYSPEHAFAQWQRLRMPDLAVLELPAEREPRVVIPFGTLVV
jgi:broad specificity phosphatase PhoE